jgi:hypothetical protein
MSKPAALPARPIPTGILVTDVESPRKQEKPRHTPTPARTFTLPVRRSPWLWVVIGGSLSWALVVMTVAIRAGGKEVESPRTPGLPAAIAVAPPMVVEPAPADETPVDEPAPIPAVQPMPVRERPVVLLDDAPPPLVVKPEPEAKPAPPTPAKPAAIVAVPKRPRPDVDLKVYANCEVIGTDVLFVKDPPEAYRRAKAERKLVYIMHLSGDFEDKEFT